MGDKKEMNNRRMIEGEERKKKREGLRCGAYQLTLPFSRLTKRGVAQMQLMLGSYITTPQTALKKTHKRRTKQVAAI